MLLEGDRGKPVDQASERELLDRRRALRPVVAFFEQFYESNAKRGSLAGRVYETTRVNRRAHAGLLTDAEVALYETRRVRVGRGPEKVMYTCPFCVKERDRQLPNSGFRRHLKSYIHFDAVNAAYKLAKAQGQAPANSKIAKAYGFLPKTLSAVGWQAIEQDDNYAKFKSEYDAIVEQLRELAREEDGPYEKTAFQAAPDNPAALQPLPESDSTHEAELVQEIPIDADMTSSDHEGTPIVKVDWARFSKRFPQPKLSSPKFLGIIPADPIGIVVQVPHEKDLDGNVLYHYGYISEFTLEGYNVSLGPSTHLKNLKKLVICPVVEEDQMYRVLVDNPATRAGARNIPKISYVEQSASEELHGRSHRIRRHKCRPHPPLSPIQPRRRRRTRPTSLRKFLIGVQPAVSPDYIVKFVSMPSMGHLKKGQV